jgi:hypothetical protein
MKLMSKNNEALIRVCGNQGFSGAPMSGELIG